MKLFKCQHCAQLLYFENAVCLGCGRRLGYAPEQASLTALDPDGELWQSSAFPRQQFKACANATYDACNWLVPARSDDRFCLACRHNQVVPDLSFEENLVNWRKLEIAKHHMFYSLLRLRLPLRTRIEDAAHGLAFEFLSEDATNGKKILTGHDDGLITLNLAEADDATREKLRQQMGEPYRTLLGHFRHEIGHYYWDRLVRDENRLAACRAVFGDDDQDYDAALQAYYANGPAPNWQDSHISAYATAHPWEDFAETWAHYLHIVDTLEMAGAFGIHTRLGIDGKTMVNAEAGFDPHGPGPIEPIVEAWLPLAAAVNSINRCMGQPDLYPFVLSAPVVEKLRFIHEMVHAGRDAVPDEAETDMAPDLENAG